MSLFLVISALVIVTIMVFSSHWFAAQNLRQMRSLIDRRQSSLLARSAIACAVAQITDQMRLPQSGIAVTLQNPSLATGTSLPIDQAPLQDLISLSPRSAARVAVWISRLEPLSPKLLGVTTGGADEVERSLLLHFRAEGDCGGCTTVIDEERELRVLSLVPGVLGKFTLFVRQVEPNPDAYNLFANTLDGLPDDRESPDTWMLPVVFSAGGGLDRGQVNPDQPESYRERGYFYLGGGRVTLNVTAGNHDEFGENFTFFQLGTPPKQPSYFPKNPPDFFSPPPGFSANRHPQSLNGADLPNPFAFILNFIVAGFHTTDANGGDMNLQDRLSVSFPKPPVRCDPRMRSSVLHLFGSRVNPSPALVLGEVYRRYAEYAGVVVDCTGNTTRDAILGCIPQSNDGLAVPALFPNVATACVSGDLPPGTEIRMDENWFRPGNIFPSQDEYRTWSSHLKTEPYLQAYDNLFFSQPGGFGAKQSFFGGPVSTCDLSFHPSLARSVPFFQNGDLEKLPKEFLLGKAVYRVRDQKEFFRLFTSGSDGSLELDGAVVVPGESAGVLALPSPGILRKGGILIVEQGNVRIGRLEPGPDPYQMLTVVVLDGDVELDPAQGGRANVYLVALNGTVRTLDPSRPIDLRGGMAVGRLAPNAFPAGGQVVFDSAFDPTADSMKYLYRAHLSDITRTLVVQREM